MDFGKILEQWDSRGEGRAGNPADRDGPPSRRDPGGEPRESRYQRMRKQEPQAELDLHGLRASEAQAALERFLRDAAARGLGKVLIIHGKGNHTRGQPVLEGAVRAWLERSPIAGAFGRAERRHGGSGATWVILREWGSGARV